ncbi:MAG TPA: serine hydrolase domain-containing protein [Candidatus Limnocylindrales bacterium]|nr:serine hydrolase domain-containing protein [Candidatus Limnocylindrales bacterium]
MGRRMNDERIRRRLREDPTGDPEHEPGLLFERLATAAATPAVRTRINARWGGQLALLVGAVVIGLAIGLRQAPSGPGSSPTPAASTPSWSMNPERLQASLEEWAARNGGPSLSLTVIGTLGAESTISRSSPGRPAPAAVRIGEVSRVFLVSAVVGLAQCSSTGELGDCPLPVARGAFGLDDRVSRWRVGVPGDPTVRQLLDGSSGLAAIAPSLQGLRTQVLEDPTADWSRAAVLAAALASPPRFAPGAQHSPVDTEALLLEDLISRATARPPGDWIDASTILHMGLGQTHLSGPAPGGIARGHDAAGTALVDLEPALLDLVGNEAGMTSDSTDLARFAVAAWGSAILRPPSWVALVTDASDGHRQPWGATGVCPCVDGQPTVIAQLGDAVGWAALAAYDFEDHVAVAVVVDADPGPAAMGQLLTALVGVIRD